MTFETLTGVSVPFSPQSVGTFRWNGEVLRDFQSYLVHEVRDEIAQPFNRMGTLRAFVVAIVLVEIWRFLHLRASVPLNKLRRISRRLTTDLIW